MDNNADMWNTLRMAAEAMLEGDIGTANAIVMAANIRCRGVSLSSDPFFLRSFRPTVLPFLLPWPSLHAVIL